jgi:ABC-type glycerol-3-phosphate transport system substrate-binding protein
MMTKTILVISILLLITACSPLTVPSSPTPEPAMTIIVEWVPTPTPSAPLTEAEVPRVSLEKANAAIASGAAIVIDVRSQEAYAVSHIPGAVNIQLGEFETNPTGWNLDKDQWIITYCT